MTELTEDRLAEIKEMLKKITPGDWEMIKRDTSHYMYGFFADIFREEDARFIIAAPQIVDELVKELENRLREIEWFKSMVKSDYGSQNMYDYVENDAKPWESP